MKDIHLDTPKSCILDPIYKKNKIYKRMIIFQYPKVACILTRLLEPQGALGWVKLCLCRSAKCICSTALEAAFLN